MQAAAVLVSLRWTLLLSACFAQALSADCGTDCAYCALRLRLQQTHLNSIACVLQCEGQLNSASSWDLCRDILQASEGALEANQIPTESTATEHQEEKRYGGFMKRYGGFMKRYGGFMKRYGGFMKKRAEVHGPEMDDADRSGEILSNVDVARLAKLVENDGEKEEARMRNVATVKGGPLEGVAKRYGGFMRRGYNLEGGDRPLAKRYGGFMRRVGRPEWGEEIKPYGGFLKRAPHEEEEEESEEVEKRYGGFMDY